MKRWLPFRLLRFIAESCHDLGLDGLAEPFVKELKRRGYTWQDPGGWTKAS